MLRALIVMLALAAAAVGQGQNAVDVKPSPQQVAWQELETCLMPACTSAAKAGEL